MPFDRLDIEPYDPELLQEIQMLANLILACSTGPARLCGAAIDTALGLPQRVRQNVA